jgi:hypothetical protein
MYRVWIAETPTEAKNKSKWDPVSQRQMKIPKKKGQKKKKKFSKEIIM